MNARPGAEADALRRRLGLLSTTMIVVGGTIGGGIFFAPAEVARALPDGTWIMAIWVLGGLVAFAGALTFAELGAMLPDAGGPYVFLREAFGGLAAFLYGWMLLAMIATAATAAVARAFADYMARFVDFAPIGGPVGLAILVIVALTLTNLIGMRPGAVLQNVLTIAKVAALIGLIAGGLIAWTRLGGWVPAAVVPAPRTTLATGLAAAFIPVLFTIGGWQQMTMVAGEVRNPERTIPRALLLGAGIIVACYIAVNAVYLRALGRDGLAASTAVAADTATAIIGPIGATLISIAAAISILGIMNVIVLATPRVLYAMAKDGVFLQIAARVHPRFGTPHWSLLLLGGWSIALLLLAEGSLGTLLAGVVFADWIFFALGAASVFVLRGRRAGAPRPYRVWGYPVLPAFFVLAALAGLASAVVSAPRQSLLGAGLVAIGAVVYAITSRARP